MILVDSSVWIDHLRTANQTIVTLTRRGELATHSLVIGELAMGSIRDQANLLFRMQKLPSLRTAEDEEVLTFVERRKLYGREIGYIDAHLLFSVVLTKGASLWTRDKRLREIAEEFEIAPHLPGARLQ